jgi:hypothetical protein
MLIIIEKQQNIIIFIMKTKPDNNPVTLENYDGRKAYYGVTRYSVIELNGVKYAFPDTSEQIQLSGVVEQEKLERKFPIFQIVNENSGHEQATAVSVNNKRRELSQLLERISQDFQ